MASVALEEQDYKANCLGLTGFFGMSPMDESHGQAVLFESKRRRGRPPGSADYEYHGSPCELIWGHL